MSVSAASFLAVPLASESLVAHFGSNLSTTTSAASSIPLPTTLGGTTVMVTDSAGIERPAPLLYVAPGQINYQIPPATALGLALITITNGDGDISRVSLPIAPVSPGLFSVNSNGVNIAAALILRIKLDGSQVYEPVVRYDAAENRFIPIPIDLGPDTDQVFLMLFGAGFRRRTGLSNVKMRINGQDAGVLYASEQGDFVGLDQINALLPRRLSGLGLTSVEVIIDGKAANPVSVSIR